MTDSQPFKNFYGVNLAELLADKIGAVYPTFAADSFVQYVAARVAPLELKARVHVIRDALHNHLPLFYPAQLDILLATLGDELDPTHEHGGMFNQGYWVMPIAAFVQHYGLDYYDESVRGLYEITKRFSSEEAIRPYLVRHADRLLPTLHAWTRDPSMHVRRLVSEGTRTRLPWAMRLPMFIDDPTPVFDLLELLKDDPALYVRRSVANNLNDIAKDHPAHVVETLARWNDGASDGTRYIIRHALRHQVKLGDPAALAVLGYNADHDISVSAFSLDKTSARIGESILLRAILTLQGDEAHNAVIDYVVHYVKATGKISPKVFKWTTTHLNPGDTLTIEKKHVFRDVSIRAHHAGIHRIEIQVNGKVLAGAEVALEAVQGRF